MLTIGIPQLYCGASGKKGAYNRQEIGLAKAYARLGCRAVAFYPAVGAAGDAAIETEEISVEGCPAGTVQAWYLPAKALSVHALYAGWQPLLDAGVQAVHCMGDTSLGVPGLEAFCRKHDIFFFSQLGAVHSDADSALRRTVMDLLAKRNLAVYRRTPAFAKTPTVAAEMQRLGVPCAGVMPVGLDTSIIPETTPGRVLLRKKLGLCPDADVHYLLFVGRLDGYKRPLDIAGVLQALPQNWRAVVIGNGALAGQLDELLEGKNLKDRCLRIPSLPNTAVQEYYHACDAFLNCSDKEIFGMSLLEAMWSGCVPVARHAPGPDFIVEDGVSGILGDTNAQLAAGLQRAAAGDEMAAAAQARVMDHFLWDTSAAQALAMLKSKGVPGCG